MPALYSHTTRATGTTLTAAIYNSDHQNHIDNGVPSQLDDYSNSSGQMQSTVDPGESGTESLATSLAGEIERLRFAIQDIKTFLGLTSAEWYSTPAGTIAKSRTDTQRIPQNSKSTNYTLGIGDAYGHMLHPSSDDNARTFTIDSNANVSYDIGTTITFVNEINVLNIAITADTLTMAGTGSTGTRQLAASGMATALKVAATKWIIAGTGLS